MFGGFVKETVWAVSWPTGVAAAPVAVPQLDHGPLLQLLLQSSLQFQRLLWSGPLLQLLQLVLQSSLQFRLLWCGPLLQLLQLLLQLQRLLWCGPFLQLLQQSRDSHHRSGCDGGAALQLLVGSLR